MEDRTVKANVNPDFDDNFYNEGFKFQGMTFGLIGGVLMALFLMAFQAADMENNIASKFLKYLVFIPVVVYAIRKHAMRAPDGKIFKRGIILGAVMSLVAALTLIAINLIATLISPEIAFNKFGAESDGGAPFLVISAIQLFEVFVFGMIITFACIQFFKGSSRQS